MRVAANIYIVRTAGNLKLLNNMPKIFDLKIKFTHYLSDSYLSRQLKNIVENLLGNVLLTIHVLVWHVNYFHNNIREEVHAISH